MTSSVIMLSTIRKIFISSGLCSAVCLPPVSLHDHLCLIELVGGVYFRPRQSDYFTAR